MKRVTVAIAVAAVVIVAGVTLYLHQRTPEPPQVALPAPITPAPMSPPVVPPPIIPPISPPVLPPTPPVVPPPPIIPPPPMAPAPAIPPNFLFPDTIWQNAFMLRKTDGTWLSGVGLSQIPIGTIINAPISGYLSTSIVTFRDQTQGSSTRISIDPGPISRQPPYFRIVGASLEILVPMGQSRVGKGEPWVKIVSDQEIDGRFDKPVVLMISAIPRDEVMGAIDETTDPREFLFTATMRMLEQK